MASPSGNAATSSAGLGRMSGHIANCLGGNVSKSIIVKTLIGQLNAAPHSLNIEENDLLADLAVVTRRPELVLRSKVELRAADVVEQVKQVHASHPTATDLASELAQKYGTELEWSDITGAAEIFEPTAESLVYVSTSAVISRLVEYGKLPQEALADVDAAKVKPRRGKTSTGLALVHQEHRPKSQTDEDNLDWMRQVQETDKKFRDGEKAGKPFRPDPDDLQPSKDGLNVFYPDPMSHLLEPHDMGRNARGGVNRIFINDRQFALFQNDPKKNYTWRSVELLRAFERKFLSLWCVPTICDRCGLELSGLTDEIKKLIRGELILPETPGYEPKQWFTGAKAHGWCLDFIRERIQIELGFMKAAKEYGDPNAPVAVAARSAQYVNMFNRVQQKHLESGVTRSELVLYWKAIQANTKEMTDSAR